VNDDNGAYELIKVGVNYFGLRLKVLISEKSFYVFTGNFGNRL
jgi:hypothetical protein